MEQLTGLQLGKEYDSDVYYHTAYLTYTQSTSWETLGWRKHKLESRLPEEIINNLRYADDTTLMAEATVRTGHGTTDWFQIGKAVCQGCILSPCWFNLYTEYIMRNARLEETQAGIKIAGRNINNLRYADDTTPLWQKVKKN